MGLCGCYNVRAIANNNSEYNNYASYTIYNNNRGINNPSILD